jgi:thymidylate kinase
MKLIIIEGTDNTGKDTLISKILEKYPTATVIHCGKPITKKYSSKEQDELFRIYAENIVEGKYDNTHVIIMNRSHIGEYVYGVLYRNRSKDDVGEMIFNVNDILSYRKDLEIRYIQLLSKSESLLRNNEDGKSLSNGNVEKILKEAEQFEEIFNMINISDNEKKLIYVNDGDKFRSREDIFNEAFRFING